MNFYIEKIAKGMLKYTTHYTIILLILQYKTNVDNTMRFPCYFDRNDRIE